MAAFDAPKKEDVLFSGDPASWHTDAILNYQDDGDYAYRTGYRLAGRVLTE
jgi:hypothetical protein